MTKNLKVYSNHKPNFSNTSLEIYNIKDGGKSNSLWYSEIKIDDYTSDRLKLEQLGYTAHPMSYQEIDSREYTLFKVVE